METPVWASHIESRNAVMSGQPACKLSCYDDLKYSHDGEDTDAEDAFEGGA